MLYQGDAGMQHSEPALPNTGTGRCGCCSSSSTCRQPCFSTAAIQHAGPAVAAHSSLPKPLCSPDSSDAWRPQLPAGLSSTSSPQWQAVLSPALQVSHRRTVQWTDAVLQPVSVTCITRLMQPAGRCTGRCFLLVRHPNQTFHPSVQIFQQPASDTALQPSLRDHSTCSNPAYDDTACICMPCTAVPNRARDILYMATAPPLLLPHALSAQPVHAACQASKAFRTADYADSGESTGRAAIRSCHLPRRCCIEPCIRLLWLLAVHSAAPSLLPAAALLALVSHHQGASTHDASAQSPLCTAHKPAAAASISNSCHSSARVTSSSSLPLVSGSSQP